MRIDKLLSECAVCSRKDAARSAKRGEILVNGVAVKDVSKHIDPVLDVVTFMGNRVEYRKFTYVMLNKPTGYVSATEDRHLPFVTELLPDNLRALELFPVGRLDKDTVGLMILTNDGQTAHRVLSPKRHVKKVYRFECDLPLPDGAEEKFLNSITLKDGYECKSALLELDPFRTSGYVTLTEGKYHQIKRMMASLGSHITFLERVSFGGIVLDTSLKRGSWRMLTESEINLLVKNIST